MSVVTSLQRSVYHPQFQHCSTACSSGPCARDYTSTEFPPEEKSESCHQYLVESKALTAAYHAVQSGFILVCLQSVMEQEGCAVFELVILYSVLSRARGSSAGK